jgi:hypothetical protein
MLSNTDKIDTRVSHLNFEASHVKLSPNRAIADYDLMQTSIVVLSTHAVM